MEDWQLLQVHMVIPLYIVSLLLHCTSYVPASAPEQAIFCDHLKSNINFPPTLENPHHVLILSPSLLCTIRIRVYGLTSNL